MTQSMRARWHAHRAEPAHMRDPADTSRLKQIVGASPAMREVLEMVARLVPTRSTVPAPAGSYVIHYGGKVHYDGAKTEETIIQVWGMGPATSTPAEKR